MPDNQHHVVVDADQLEEARRFNEGLEQLLANVPAVHTVEPAVSRRADIWLQ